MVELGDAGQSKMLQDMDASVAELDMHGAIVHEFATEVISLESDVRDLAYSMRTVASLTAQQGEVIDDIESHMARVEEQTSGAREQLVQASNTQQKGNRQMWRILFSTSIFMT